MCVRKDVSSLWAARIVSRKLLHYDGDTLDELPPVPLRLILDGQFMSGQGS